MWVPPPSVLPIISSRIDLYSRLRLPGLIVWAEIPFVNRVTGYEAENAQSQLRELIRQNFQSSFHLRMGVAQ